MMKSIAAHSGKEPPTEVALRKPLRVVRPRPRSRAMRILGKARRYQGASTIARKSLACFERKLVAVADDEDPMPGLKPEKECREGHRHRQGLEMAWRHVDDEAIDLAPADALELIGNGLDMPVRQKRHAGVERHQAALARSSRKSLRRGGIEQDGPRSYGCSWRHSFLAFEIGFELLEVGFQNSRIVLVEVVSSSGSAAPLRRRDSG